MTCRELVSRLARRQTRRRVVDAALAGVSVSSAALVLGVLLVTWGFSARPSVVLLLLLPAGAVVGAGVCWWGFGATDPRWVARRIDLVTDSDDLLLSAYELSDDRSELAREVDHRAARVIERHASMDLPYRYHATSVASPVAVVVLALVFASAWMADLSPMEDDHSNDVASALVLRVSRGAGAAGDETSAEQLRRLAEKLRRGRVSIERARQQLQALSQTIDRRTSTPLPSELARALAEDIERIARALGDTDELTRLGELESRRVLERLQDQLRDNAELASMGGAGDIDRPDPETLRRLLEAAPAVPDEVDLSERVVRYEGRRALTEPQRRIVLEYFRRRRETQSGEATP